MNLTRRLGDEGIPEYMYDSTVANLFVGLEATSHAVCRKLFVLCCKNYSVNPIPFSLCDPPFGPNIGSPSVPTTSAQVQQYGCLPHANKHRSDPLPNYNASRTFTRTDP